MFRVKSNALTRPFSFRKEAALGRLHFRQSLHFPRPAAVRCPSISNYTL